MKYILSKSFFAQLPPPIAEVIDSWRKANRRRFISVEMRASVYIQEDAKYTAFSADCLRSKSARAAGEWAGLSGLRPTDRIEIPPGCSLIETGFFLGQPFLHLYHHDADQFAALKAEHAKTLSMP